MDAIDAESRGLCGWQEVFTDFDSWVCKLNRHLDKRSSHVIKSIEINLEDPHPQKERTHAIPNLEKEKTLGSLSLHNLLADGLTLENKQKVHIIKNLGVSWGTPQHKPVLLVHGYMDSAATFIPIVKLLPDDYFYLAVDLPGHGKSDPFPVGMLISQGHQVAAVRLVVRYFQWNTFVYMAHSVGFAIGVMYNFLYPFEIVKSVNLDPVPPLSTFCFHQYSHVQWYQYHYDDYYDNYSRWESHRKKEYTYDQAIQLLVRSRKLSKEQSAVVLSRTLIPVKGGMFRLSWEPTMKKVVGVNITEDTLCSIVTKNAPPTLYINASIDDTIKPFKKNGVRIVKRFQESMPNLFVHNVIGTHDVHITNPESFVDRIIEFLKTDFTNPVKAKL